MYDRCDRCGVYRVCDKYGDMVCTGCVTGVMLCTDVCDRCDVMYRCA